MKTDLQLQAHLSNGFTIKVDGDNRSIETLGQVLLGAPMVKFVKLMRPDYTEIRRLTPVKEEE